MKIYISGRCKNLLEMLLSTNECISFEEIAKELKVNKRSVYYDVFKLNEWLRYNDLSEIIQIRSKGLKLKTEDKATINKVMQETYLEERVILSPTQRVKSIYCYIYISRLNEAVRIEQIAEYCMVSKNTVINDMKILSNKIKEYGIYIEQDNKKGYKFVGDSIVMIRAIFFAYYQELLIFFNKGEYNIFRDLEINVYLEKLTKIANKLNIELVEGTLMSLASLVPHMYSGEKRPEFHDINIDEILKTNEMKLVENEFHDLDVSEKIYLAIHFLGSRVSFYSKDIFNEEIDESTYQLTKGFVSEFEKISCLNIKNREDLERNLFEHLSRSLYRYKYGVQIDNRLHEEILYKYNSLFQITKRASRYLEVALNVKIHDEEIAFLALYFGGYLRDDFKEKNLALICTNSNSTRKMMYKEIQKLLPDANIVNYYSVLEFLERNKSYDLIITTKKIDLNIPQIVVGPVLSDSEKIQIKHHFKLNNRNDMKLEDKLFRKIKKYLEPKYENKVKSIIQETLAEGIHTDGNLIDLGSLIKKEHIHLFDDDTDLINKDVNHQFIAPNVVLINLNESQLNDFIKLSFSKKPVKFKNNSFANTIIEISIDNDELKLKIINELTNFFNNKHNVLTLLKCENINDIYMNILELYYK